MKFRFFKDEEIFLFYGLPVVKRLVGDDWILFSYYSKKKIVIKNRKDFTEELFRSIQSKYPLFFSKPKETANEYTRNYNLVLSLTNDCNLRCAYCFVDGGSQKNYISHSSIEKNVDEVLRFIAESNKNKLSVSFFGGEPTMCFDLIKFTLEFLEIRRREYEAEKGINIPTSFSITTNGVFNKNILNFLTKKKFNVSLSMDGLPHSQNSQRPLPNGEGSSKIVEENIVNLIDNGIFPRIRVTITKENCLQMPDIVRHLSRLGAKEIQFEPVTECNLAQKNKTLRPDKKDFVEQLIESFNEAKKNGVSVANSSFMRMFMPTIHYCDGMGDSRRIVNPDGTISRCVEVNTQNHPASEFFIVNNLFTPTKKNSNTCTDCFARYICAGGCPSRNFHYSGHIDTPDIFRCFVVKNVVPYLINVA